jgi:hypothetical protein
MLRSKTAICPHLGWSSQIFGLLHPKEKSVTTIKLLSAGIIVTAMLATAAMARENYAAMRHVAGEANTSTFPTTRYTDGRVGAPRVDVLPAPPDGEDCDIGDNPHIC